MMRRSLFFFIKVAVLVAVAVWLANRPGSVAIEWQGYLLETSFFMLVVAAASLALLAAVLYRIWRALVTSPGAFGRYRAGAKRERGYRALTQGMVAVAAGDADTARRSARKADALLNDPPLTLLLSAQAAQLDGDEQAARRYFEAMLKRPETEFLGLRGLLMQALKAGDRARALELARRARTLEPKSHWPTLACLELETAAGNWTEAEGLLDRAVRLKALPADRGRQHRVALLMEEVRQAQADGNPEKSLNLVQKAHDLLPGFVPAAVQLARFRAGGGNVRAANRALTAAWAINPHPDLAAAWGAVTADAAPLDQVKRYEALLALNPAEPEGHLALAEAALRAQLWGLARSHLLTVADQRPTARVWRLLAEAAKGEGGAENEAAIRDYLSKAMVAEPDSAWVCGNCGAVSTRWGAVCGHCAGFNTLVWKQPGPNLRPAGRDSDTLLMPPPHGLIGSPAAPPLVREVEPAT